MPILHINLLGGFRLRYDGTLVTTIVQPRMQAFLAYLLIHRDSPQPRQQLAFLFWPDTSESQAYTNLRQLLHHLRKNLPDAERFLSIRPKTVQWHSDSSYTLDVHVFEQTIASAVKQGENIYNERTALETAIKTYNGELLPGCYDDWIIPERERLNQLYLKALDIIIQLCETLRDYQSGIGFTEKLIRQDPLLETAYLQKMRLYSLKGDRTAALRVYHNYSKVMERELGIEPTQAMQQAYLSLLNKENLSEGSQNPGLRSPSSSGLVGRYIYWQQLLSAWKNAAAGHPSLVLISGEVGIGKTRLGEEFLEWAVHQGGVAAETRSYAAEGRLAYAPVAELLRTDLFREGLSNLDTIWLTELTLLLPELLERPDLSKRQSIADNWQRKCLFEALARAIFSVKEPLVLLFDDLQWCDQDTLDWLHFLLRFRNRAKLLIIGIIRSTDVDESHPIIPVLFDLRNREQITEIELDPLDREETARLAEQVSGRHLDADQVSRLYLQSEGNPLFVVEMVRAEENRNNGDNPFETPDFSSQLKTSLHQQPNPNTDLPPKVYSIIQARLRQLSPDARELANLAATIGRAFTFDILLDASEMDDERLVKGLDELWRRRIVREQGGSDYDFSHDIIREVAYTEISNTRRVLFHRKVARALEKIHALNLDQISSQVATHYEASGLLLQAMVYYIKAIRVAQQTFSNSEVIRLATRALAFLPVLPASAERNEAEIDLLFSLGTAYMWAKGYGHPDAEHVFLRVWELCKTVEHSPYTISVLVGLWLCYHIRGDIPQEKRWVELLSHEAQNGVDKAVLPVIHFATLATAMFQGEFLTAKYQGETGTDLYQSQKQGIQSSLVGYDAEIALMIYWSHSLWLLGYPDQAKRIMQQAVMHATDSKHPGNIALAMSLSCVLYQFCGDVSLVKSQTEKLVAYADENLIPYWIPLGQLYHGWAIAQEGQIDQGIKELKQGLETLQAMGIGISFTYNLALLAEVCTVNGRMNEAAEAVTAAMALVKAGRESWFEAEIYRHQGEVCFATGEEAEAEGCFLQAIETARLQNARSFELRAAMSLSRLWQRQGKDNAARSLLEDIYGWFIEGFDTADLCQAGALLDVLV